MSPTGSDGAPSAPTPVSFDASHESATGSPAVVQGETTLHEIGDDITLRILAVHVDLRARMTQMKVSLLKSDEDGRITGTIEPGMFRSAR